MTTAVGYIRKESRFERLFQSKLFWSLLCLTLFAYPIFRSVYRDLPPELPIYSKVPEFNLTNEFNKSFGSKDLKGKVYIGSFAFTSCGTVCPGLMEKMQTVQKRVRGMGTKIGLLTFTVDPENDTPKVLHKYARDLHANPHVWNFLTGTEKDLESLLVKGFKVPMGEAEMVKGQLEDGEVELWDIAHTEKLVLVDGDAQIRGYYSVDKDSINKLMIDVGLLVNRMFN